MVYFYVLAYEPCRDCSEVKFNVRNHRFLCKRSNDTDWTELLFSYSRLTQTLRYSKQGNLNDGCATRGPWIWGTRSSCRHRRDLFPRIVVFPLARNARPCKKNLKKRNIPGPKPLPFIENFFETMKFNGMHLMYLEMKLKSTVKFSPFVWEKNQP